MAVIGKQGKSTANNPALQAKAASGKTIQVEVIDIAERSYKNKPAIAILFSTPLNKSERYDQYVEISKFSKSGVNKAKGGLVFNDNGRVLYFTNVDPQTKYNIKVLSGIKAANKTILDVIKEKKITTRKITPAYGFASKGSILPGKLAEGLPIITINVPEVDLQFLRVEDNKVSQFLNAYQRKYNYYWSASALSKYSKSVYLGRFKTQAQANQRTITHIPVKDIKELQKPGLYIAVMTQPGQFSNRIKSTYYMVTDIGLHARLYKNKFQVHARSLLSTKSIQGVKVKLFSSKGQLLAEKYTNSKGVAKFNFRPPHRSSVIAQLDDDTSIFSFKDPALDLSEFKTKGPHNNDLETFVYSSRDLFRPGEAIDFSILLRDQDGKGVTRIPLNLVIKRPDGKAMHTLTLNAHSEGSKDLGYFSYRYGIPTDGQTGKWSLEVRTSPGSKIANHSFKFHVEEFLPERMKLDLVNKQETLTRSNKFEIKAVGAYLYGAPAAGNRITAVLNRYPSYYPVPTLKKFFFGDINEVKEKLRKEFLDDKLDKKGEFNVSIKPLKTKYNSPMAMAVTTSIFESGGRPVTRSIKRTVWPAKALIGVRPLFSGKFADTNSTVSFEVIKATGDGTLQAAKNLEVKVIQEDREYYWSFSANGGWSYKFTEAQYPILVQNLSIDTSKRAKLSIPVKHGSYRLEIKDLDTNLTMRHRFYAGWNWEEKSKASSSRPDKVTMILDKQRFKSGDTVKVRLRAPHQGIAVVFVESDRLLARKELYVSDKKDTIVEFKIKPEWASRHDVYITSIVYRSGKKKDFVTPNRAIGITHLPLDRESRKLAVKLQLPEKMQPSKKLRIKVKVDSIKNERAIVTVSAVDLGILNITDFKTPDPNTHFFAQRAYAVDQYDHYGKVIESQAGVRAKLRFGAGFAAKLNQNKPDKAKVKTVALFSGPVNLDEKGEAMIELDVPDYNGSLRVMAVAFTNDRYGSQEQEIIIASPVIAEIALPRFISPGDKSSLTLDLHNLSGASQKLKVNIEVNSMLKFKRVNKIITLQDKEKKTFRYHIYGNQAFGVGKISLNVAGKKIDLNRKWEINVRPAYPSERRFEYKVIKPGETYLANKSLLKKLMPETVDGTLLVSSTPPLNIRNAVKGLLQYPYGCLEQTTSRAFPLVYIDENKARAVGLKPMSIVKRAELIQKALTRIRSMQKTSGGFGLWNSAGPEEPWLTPYVIDFMIEAKNAGFSVPEDMLQAGLKNLKTRLGNRRRIIGNYFYTTSPKHLRFSANAYAAYTLSKVQRAPLGTLRTLYDNHRKDAKSGLPLIQLGIALKLQGDHTRGDASIKLGLTKMPTLYQYLGDYGTPERDRALAYALLARHDMLTSQSDKLIFELGNRLKTKFYLSTQDRLAIFLAGYELGKNSNTEWQADLVFNNKTLDIDAKGRYVRAFNFSQIKTGVSIKSKAKIKLYAMFQVNGYPSAAPKPRSEDVEVSRTLYDMQGKEIKRKSFKVGELLIAHLSIRGTQRTDNAMVVDLLPAGFEIENLNISKGENLDKLIINGKNPKKMMANNNILHQEYRDDRFAAAIKVRRWRSTDLFYLIRVVSPGVYNVPPPHVEDMYRPDWYGLGETPDKITVVNYK